MEKIVGAKLDGNYPIQLKEVLEHQERGFTSWVKRHIRIDHKAVEKAQGK